jgi:hypothetical protein
MTASGVPNLLGIEPQIFMSLARIELCSPQRKKRVLTSRPPVGVKRVRYTVPKIWQISVGKEEEVPCRENLPKIPEN